MTVIETKGLVDNNGNLSLHHPLKIKGKKVRVIIQVLEDANSSEVEERTMIETPDKKQNESGDFESEMEEFSVDEEEDDFSDY
jgi:hypothetical protein